MRKQTAPTIDELMERDPQFAALVAALRFEAAEADRYQKERSFIWRHNGAFFTLSFVMIAACMALIFVVLPGQDVSDADDMPAFYGILALGFGGFFLLLLTMVMSEARNVFTGSFKVITVTALCLVFAVPAYIGFDAVVHVLIG